MLLIYGWILRGVALLLALAGLVLLASARKFANFENFLISCGVLGLALLIGIAAEFVRIAHRHHAERAA
jgi:hypothetical protein